MFKQAILKPRLLAINVWEMKQNILRGAEWTCEGRFGEDPSTSKRVACHGFIALFLAHSNAVH